MSASGREGPTAERELGAPWVGLGKRNLSFKRRKRWAEKGGGRHR